jgi:hypothetical protein
VEGVQDLARALQLAARVVGAAEEVEDLRDERGGARLLPAVAERRRGRVRALVAAQRGVEPAAVVLEAGEVVVGRRARQRIADLGRELAARVRSRMRASSKRPSAWRIDPRRLCQRAFAKRRPAAGARARASTASASPFRPSTWWDEGALELRLDVGAELPRRRGRGALARRRGGAARARACSARAPAAAPAEARQRRERPFGRLDGVAARATQPWISAATASALPGSAAARISSAASAASARRDDSSSFKPAIA